MKLRCWLQYHHYRGHTNTFLAIASGIGKRCGRCNRIIIPWLNCFNLPNL